MDPLGKLLDNATDIGLLSRLNGCTPRLRTSLYADDATVFLHPAKEDVDNFSQLLSLFGEATGLKTNMHKTQVAPIRCAEIDMPTILQSFLATVKDFPMKYLGLPVSITKLNKIHFQPILDKAGSRLANWQGKMLNAKGRSTLVKAVLSALPTYHMTALKVPAGTLHALDKLRRRFLWTGGERLSGGKCKVKWDNVCKPKELGGLGILDLPKFGRALRLRWLWFEWEVDDPLWAGMPVPCDDVDRQIFNAATTIHLGDGARTNFWSSRWLDGQTTKDIAPLIFQASKRKNKKVNEALTGGKWIEDLRIQDFNMPEHFQEFVKLWTALQQATLIEYQRDEITWNLTASGSYTAKSAYRMQFEGMMAKPFQRLVWEPWAPPKCKCFAWLILQNRVWTADRLQRRAMANQSICPLCRTTQETAVHLLAKCRLSIRIWKEMERWTGYDLHLQAWPDFESVAQWWEEVATLPGIPKKPLRSLLIMVSWTL
jgi:hypothetical protein